MGETRALVSSTATSRRQGATVAEHARGTEWRAVDSTHRRCLARFARSLSALPNLSSAFPTVGAFWAAHPLAAETGRGLTRSRETRSERSVHRRQLQQREKGGSAVGPTKRGKGSKIVAIADRHGLPIAVHVASARPNEAILVEACLGQRFLTEAPTRLIGDKAYDSDPLDQRLRNTLGVQLISPHRWNRSKPATQDGRSLRRYRRRWKIERLFAWLHNFRRLVVRWEYHSENFFAMIQLACAVILLRHL